MSNLVELIIPFIILAIFGTMVDQITLFLEDSMKSVKWLPDKFESKIAFVIVVTVGYRICYMFDFNLFAYLNHPGRDVWAGYFFTALLIGGGTSFLKKNFNNMDAIPGILRGLSTQAARIIKLPGSNNKEVPNDLPDVSKDKDI